MKYRLYFVYKSGNDIQLVSDDWFVFRSREEAIGYADYSLIERTDDCIGYEIHEYYERS